MAVSLLRRVEWNKPGSRKMNVSVLAGGFH
jgi:hypothetical protein